MPVVFDMRRLYHGCGESLRNKLDSGRQTLKAQRADCRLLPQYSVWVLTGTAPDLTRSGE